ncbi:MAG TPA: CDP-alcohol phosphatidyltransferase family protein, partial [Polyangiaceae bacterium]|nr:CDP-alcohol phosphatidyltransferase family protein [Polyangiaceae bacterium]
TRPHWPKPTTAKDSWSRAHAVAMLAGAGIAMALRMPLVVMSVAVSSFSLLIVQSRGGWTPNGKFGVANSVTAVRVLLTFALLIRVEEQPRYAVALAALVVLGLDLVDGWLARRFAEQGPFGGCFDMEVDAAFVLSVSFSLWVRGVAGPWVILAGLWRYLFVVIPMLVPSRGGEAPRSLLYRSTYALMVIGFVSALIVPAHGELLSMLSTVVISASFLRSFYYRYAPPPQP